MIRFIRLENNVVGYLQTKIVPMVSGNVVKMGNNNNVMKMGDYSNADGSSANAICNTIILIWFSIDVVIFSEILHHNHGFIIGRIQIGVVRTEQLGTMVVLLHLVAGEVRQFDVLG